MKKYIFSIFIVSALTAFFLPTPEVNSQQSLATKAKIDLISKEIAGIRGMQFKRPVDFKYQSMEDFKKYLDKIIAKQMPDKRLKYYGKIVKKLGLHRGPEIEDFKSMAKMVFGSQVAAYYDPDLETFYVVMQKLPEKMLGALYAHELYHGLQDQYFDLDAFLLSQTGGSLNDDELLARQAVVEGEANYIMTLWTLQKTLGSIPDPAMLKMMVNMQAQMDTGTLIDMLKKGAARQFQENELEKAIQDMENIPVFMLETMIGAYLKGMKFIFEIQNVSWEKINQLYVNAPVSTEQILHPEKWTNNEHPFKYEWSSFDKDFLFQEWTVIDINTIGEMQWRIIFSEHGMAPEGKEASAGWDGDIYAILKKKNNDDLLLLLYTSWDSDNDAQEFSESYLKLLKIKYKDGENPVKVVLFGKDVLIVEGGDENSANSLLAFMKKTKKTK